MDFICWDEERMLTGVAVIDDEHRQIIRDLNQLCRSHREGVEMEDVNRILKKLCRFVQTHFQHEEAVLEQRRCPARDEHRLAHAKFLRGFQEMVVEFSLVRDADQTAGEIERMVARWLMPHIYSVVASLQECPAPAEVPPAGEISDPP